MAPLALVAALCLAALRLRDRRWRFLPALAIAVYVLLAYYERFSQSGWDALPEALPLHLCDLAVLLCLWALIAPSQTLFELAYFWGLAGAAQALLQPDISDKAGFPSWYYLEYFLGHGLIFVAVFCLIGLYQLRPRPRSWVRAMLLLQVYVLLVGALDLLFHWNYGYLCQKPRGGSLMDFLGPWPLYLAWLEVLAALHFWLLSVPWRFVLKGGDREERILRATGD